MIVLMSVRPARMNSSRNAVASADDRQRDRDQHRHEGAEDDEQHDDRREQAEQLRRALLDGRELGLAVVLDRHAGRLDGLADGILHGDDRVAVLVLDRLIELRLGVGDAAVVGERVLAERIADALQPGLVVGGLELRRLEARDRLLDRRLALGRVEPLALRARRRRCSARRPARTRTRTRSGRPPSACPTPGSRTRPAANRRPSRPGRSGGRRCRPSRRRRATDAWRRLAPSARARRSRAARGLQAVPARARPRWPRCPGLGQVVPDALSTSPLVRSGQPQNPPRHMKRDASGRRPAPTEVTRNLACETRSAVRVVAAASCPRPSLCGRIALARTAGSIAARDLLPLRTRGAHVATRRRLPPP